MADAWAGSWGTSWGNSWGPLAAVVVSDVWGGSWGTSWGNSWGVSQATVVIPDRWGVSWGGSWGLSWALEEAPVVPPITGPGHPGRGGISGGARYFGEKQKERLAELIERAYRQALRIEPEVAEAIKDAIPGPEVVRPRTVDFARLAAATDAARSLLERIERISKAVEIQTAMDALIAYEIALEEDDAEALLIIA